MKQVLRACVFTSLTFFTSLYALTGAPQSQAPVFKSKVDIIQLDVSVFDKHRQPVKGLTAQNFTILEDGKPQKIVAFSTFDVDDLAPPATGWMRDVPPDVTTNDLKPESRLFVLVMDDALIPQEASAIKSAKAIAASIIEKLGPNDRTAIVFTGDNRKTQDFTSDKTKLMATLEKFNPGSASYRFGLDTRMPSSVKGDPRAAAPPEDTDLWFYQSSVRTLESVAEYLSAVPDRRKTLFWVSPGVPVDLAGAVPSNSDGATLLPPESLICLQGAPEVCQAGFGVWATRFPAAAMTDLHNRTERIFQNAQRANLTIYAIDPTGLDGMRGYLEARLGPNNSQFSRHKAIVDQDYLVAAAANTGGRAIVNTNEFGPGIAEIFDENKSYYLLAFETASPVADGKLHKLQVKVDRPDVDIRTRSGYYAPQAVTKEDKKIAKSGMSPEAVALAKSMAGILPTIGMPLRASAAAFAIPGQRLSTVTVVLGVRQPIPAAATMGRFTETTDLLTSAFTPEGDPKGAQRHTARIVLRQGTTGEAAYEVLARIDLPAGRYQLRLAAHNSTAGKEGSVFVDVTVPDYAHLPFSATPAILSAEPGRVSAPNDLFWPLLPLVPTAEREFTKRDAVTAFLRMYQNGEKPIENVRVLTTIQDASGKTLLTGTQVVSAERFTEAEPDVIAALQAPTDRRTKAVATPAPTPDKSANPSLRSADVTFQIPMAILTAGPHLLTMEATLGATSIRRDIRFEVR
jgi:VWFA-related protein